MSIRKKLVGILAAVATIATMGIAAAPATAADGIGSDAGAQANVYQSLQYLQQLNTLRARTDRTPLTPAKIVAAKNADRNTNMYNTSNITTYGSDGKAVAAVKVNSDMTSWAQARAEEIAKRAVTNPDAPLSHDNMMVTGKPSWYSQTNLSQSTLYKGGTYWDGPEALAIGYPDMQGYEETHNPINSWYSELDYETKHPNASASDLANNRQGYGHYLTEVSNLADIAGFGIAKVTSGKWKGATVSVLEIGNSKGSQGKTQTVEEALKEYAPKVDYTVTFNSNGGSTVASQTVESGSKATKPADPTKAGFTFGGWYKDAALKTLYDFNTAVTANITLYAKWDPVTITSVAQPADISTPAGIDPTDKLPGTVEATYSDGSKKDVKVTWESIAPVKYAAPNAAGFTVNGTVEGSKVKATIKVIVTAAIPQSAAVTPATVRTVATHAPELPAKATVTYSDKTTKQAGVTWSSIDASKYAQPNADGFDVTGTVSVDGKTFTVTVKVVVTARGITSVAAPADQTVESGTEPTYPAKVTATYSDNETADVTVTWTKLTKAEYGKRDGGKFTVNGTVEGYSKGVSFAVTVKPATVKTVTPTATTAQTVANTVPDLSAIKANVAWSNGDSETATVTWPTLTADQFATVGATVPVEGTVTAGGKDYKVTVNVTVVAATVVSVTAPTGVVVTVDSGTKPDFTGVKATVKWSNNTTTTVDVAWDQPKESDYKNRNGGTFEVSGKVTVAGKEYPLTITYKVNPATAKSAAIKDGVTEVTTESGTAPALPDTAVVTWSNDETTENAINWAAIDKVQYSKREGGSFTVNGTVDASKLKTLTAATAATFTVSVKVVVKPATIKSVAKLDDVTTEVGVAPKLPATVKATWSNGDVTDAPITWEAIDAEQYAKRGSFDVNGTIADTTGKTTKVTVTVKVVAKIVSYENPKVTIESGQKLELPATVKVTWSDGETSDVKVTWNKIDPALYSKREGGVFTVEGTLEDGTKITATVTVKPATVKTVQKTVPLTTVLHVPAALPETVEVTWSNGETTREPVAWESVDAAKYDKAGTFDVAGKVTVAGKEYDVTATVTVKNVTVSYVEDGVDVKTTVGTAPQMPKTVKVHWSDGTVTDEPATWAEIPANLYAKVGSFSVLGTAVVAGKTYRIKANVAVNPKYTVEIDPNKKQELPRTGASIAIIVVVLVVLAAVGVGISVARKRHDSAAASGAAHSAGAAGGSDDANDSAADVEVTEGPDALADGFAAGDGNGASAQ
ncbi:Ig-like domain-containing protein [Bifidobacterium leontopitheci]|uniref:Bacterial Ig-like domain (Group 4) n=1 Tax=Bifidobacterium leontopitheci TaxID=2650774 RepID=A0A6I1GW00_9BIFI|nr:Ig-like domain-containing protein [Bifidobacterium leontopitheci]KAB7790641.1 Bacterial Ig-like domain (group 4) [Bifidobacterium leontopitheci]